MAERERAPGVPDQPRYVDRDDSWTLAAELVTATFLWGGIGWLLDRWLATGPVLMAIGFVLGNALGVYLLWVRSHDRFARDHQELLARRERPPRSAGPARVPTPIDPYDEAPEPFPLFRERGAVPPDGGDRAPVRVDPAPEADHG